MRWIFPFLLVIFSCNLSALQRTAKPWRNQKLECQDKIKRHNRLLFYIKDKDLLNLRNLLIYYQENDRVDELNLPSSKGLTPLQHALIDHPIDGEIVEYLLSFGADPNFKVRWKEIYIKNAGRRRARIFQGWTAAHIAVRCFADQQILHLLKKYMTDFTQCDQEGYSPMRVAKTDNNKIAQAFLESFYPRINVPVQPCKKEQPKKKSKPYVPRKKHKQPLQEIRIVTESTPAHEPADPGPEKAFAQVLNVHSDIEKASTIALPNPLDEEESSFSEAITISDDPQYEYCSLLMKFGLMGGFALSLYCTPFIVQDLR